MILVDTSVVIDYTRSADARLFALFQTHDAAITGIVRAEVLHGSRDPVHRTRLVAALNCFRQEAIPATLWDTIGDHLCALRSRGVSVPFNDVVLATLAMHLTCEFWTRDNQFALIQSVLPQLRLFVEPQP